jgi:hypothetical protein
MVDVALKILLHDTLLLAVLVTGVAWGSSLSGGRGNGQSGHHLGWGTAQQVGAVEVRFKANQSQLIAFGEGVLIGVVKGEPLRLHDSRYGLDIGAGQAQEGDFTLHEQVVDELIEERQFAGSTKNDADGMEREITEGEFGVIHLIQELLDVRCLRLVEQPLQPDVRVQQIHGLVAAPFPGFVLQFNRGVFSSEVGQSSRPALEESAARGRRALRRGMGLQQQDDLDPVARFEFGAPQDDAPICLHCCCFFNGNHGARRFNRHEYRYLIQGDLARRNWT